MSNDEASQVIQPGVSANLAKTLARLVQALGPAVIQQVHQRLVAIAQEKKVVRGRRLRLDTTVVKKNIHYPTDSSLLGDGARVLTRTMKKITELTGRAGTKLRNRMRTIGNRAMEIARTSRSKGPQVQKKLQQGYRKLLTVTTEGRQPSEALPGGDRQRCEALRLRQYIKVATRVRIKIYLRLHEEG